MDSLINSSITRGGTTGEAALGTAFGDREGARIASALLFLHLLKYTF